jgi:hypothetical protein
MSGAEHCVDAICHNVRQLQVHFSTCDRLTASYAHAVRVAYRCTKYRKSFGEKEMKHMFHFKTIHSLIRFLYILIFSFYCKELGFKSQFSLFSVILVSRIKHLPVKVKKMM